MLRKGPHLYLFLLINLFGLNALHGEKNTGLHKKSKVAILFAKTGTDSVEKELLKGARIFLHNHPTSADFLKLEFFDTQGTVNGTLAALKTIKDKEYPFVVGLRTSDEALIASQTAEESEFLFITPTANLSKVAQGKKNTFQIAANEVLVGGGLARFVTNNLQRKRILVLINTRSVYSQSVAEAFMKGLQRVENIQVDKFVFNGEKHDLQELKILFKKNSPDLVFVSDSFLKSAVLVKYIHKTDPYLPFLCGDPIGSERTIKALMSEEPKIRLYFASFWSERKKTIHNEEFKIGYKALFPRTKPSEEAALTYDALLVLSKAIVQAQPEPTVDRVRYFIEHQKFDSTQGVIDFNTGPTHSPIRDIHIKVTNSTQSKRVKTLRVKWKLEP